VRATLTPSGMALFCFDDDYEEDPVTGNWYETIYRDVKGYLADQMQPDIVRPKQMPVRIDVEAMWGGYEKIPRK
jgi:hypothetical protein